MEQARLQTIETAAGTVECADTGTGAPVLFVHGSPGGADQAVLMTAFLVDAGFRVVAPSRPGYGGTPLHDGNATPEGQAALHAALLDALDLPAVAVACWSGGGPSTYLLASGHPDRVTAVAAIAAVSHAYTFEGTSESLLMAGKAGRWIMKELVHHAPKTVVQSLAKEEGDLDKRQVKELVDHIWNDEGKQAFVLALAELVTGPERHAGLANDQARFPEIGDLGLAAVTAPVLLVHGDADGDVPAEQSDHALATLPKAELLTVADGTHVAAWTDPTSDAIQARIVEHLRG
ncbi:MAG TPA: alpha/beta hydrolase [Acidimicrobiales bacterium]|jgi:pimeloyl-ACP methyl ester carboxylesterase|nr:alpha/beta hydrolase [Acidimicrobiales bacterium]